MTPSPSARRWLFLLRGIGVLLFVWIVTHIDRSQLLESFREASWPLLALGWCLFPVIYLLKSWRWHTLIARNGIVQPFSVSFRTYCSALFLGALTPGNAGEAIKIAYLHAAGATLQRATSLTILDRLYDALWIGIVALPSVYFLLLDRFAVLVWVVVGLGLILLVSGFVFQRHSLLHWQPHAITLLNWVVYYLQLLIFAHAFHIAVPLFALFSIITLAGITTLLAIAPAGLGTRDAVFLYFLRPYGVPSALIVAFTSSVFVLTMLGALIGAYCLLRTPLPRRNA